MCIYKSNIHISEFIWVCSRCCRVSFALLLRCCSRKKNVFYHGMACILVEQKFWRENSFAIVFACCLSTTIMRLVVCVFVSLVCIVSTFNIKMCFLGKRWLFIIVIYLFVCGFSSLWYSVCHIESAMIDKIIR